MTTLPTAGPLSVTLHCNKQSYSYGEDIIATYTAVNNLNKSIYIVKDLQYILPQFGNTIEIGFAIPSTGNNESSLSYYEFMAPGLYELYPNSVRTHRVKISMPIRNTTIASNDNLMFVDAPLVGEVFVYAVLGFGFEVISPQNKNPRKAFLRWQSIIESNRYRINISGKGTGTSALRTRLSPGDSPSNAFDDIQRWYVNDQARQATA